MEELFISVEWYEDDTFYSKYIKFWTLSICGLFKSYAWFRSWLN